MGNVIDDKYWPKFFDEFFKSVKDRLDIVSRAGGAREVWLQGELFIYAKQNLPEGYDIKTNHSLNSQKKYDLVCMQDKTPIMVSEIKFLGTYDFQHKNLAGSGIGKVEAGHILQPHGEHWDI